MFRNANRQKWLIGAALIAIVVGVFFLSRFPGFAQTPQLLQLSDLPERSVIFSEAEIYARGDQYEDEGHIIDSANLKLRGYTPEQQRQLSAYHSRQSLGAASEVLGNGVNVMQFVYDYASPTEAAAAVEILQNDFGQTVVPQPEILSESLTEEQSLRGARFEFTEGPEKSSSYLFIGQRDHTMVVFFVDGFDVDAVSETYHLVLEKLADK